MPWQGRYPILNLTKCANLKTTQHELKQFLGPKYYWNSVVKKRNKATALCNFSGQSLSYVATNS